MPFPFIAAALAAAGVGSAIAGSSSAKSAARTAERTATENNRIAQQNRQQNISLLQPTVDRGNAAGERLNALLGLGGGSSVGFQADRYLQDNPDVAAGFYQQSRFATPQEYADYHWNTYGRNEGRAVPQAQSPQSAQTAADDAFNAFRNSLGYQDQVNEGARAVNAGFANTVGVQSGAALKELQRDRMRTADRFFGSYTGLLDNQQRIGANGLNALVGNNNNTTNALMANNDSAGQARGNAQLATGAAISGGLNSLVNAFGYGRGSSYGDSNRIKFDAPFKVPDMVIPRFSAPRI